MSLFSENQIKEFHELFSYDEVKGILYRKVTKGKSYAGIVHGKIIGRYPTVHINGMDFAVHRVVFAMYHGYVPEEIDHINRIKHDYRIVNLRPITRSENLLNTARNVVKSGYKGITWNKKSSRWIVNPYINGKQIHLGMFDDLNEAKTILNNYNQKNYNVHI